MCFFVLFCVFFLGKIKLLKNLFPSGKKHRLKNLIRRSLYLSNNMLSCEHRAHSERSWEWTYPHDYFLAKNQSHVAPSAAGHRVTAESKNMLPRSETLLNAPFWSLIQRSTLCHVDFMEERGFAPKALLSPNLSFCSFGLSAAQDFQYPWKIAALQKWVPWCTGRHWVQFKTSFLLPETWVQAASAPTF